MNLKLLYNLTTWPNLGVNYWGIPKSGNTSIKWLLQHLSGSDPEVPSEIGVEVHREDSAIYVDPDTANSNGLRNFTVVRCPIERAKSLYKDFGTRRRLTLVRGTDPGRYEDLDYFFEKVIAESTDKDDIHIRSQTYFIKQANRLKIFQLENVSYRLPRYNQIIRPELKLSEKHIDIILKRYESDLQLINNP